MVSHYRLLSIIPLYNCIKNKPIKDKRIKALMNRKKPKTFAFWVFFMGLKILKVLPYRLLWLLAHWLSLQSPQKSPHQAPLDASAFR